MLEALRYSLRNKALIQMIYHGSDGISQRKIKVLRIDSDKILAYCYTKNGIRSFKISKILSATPIHEDLEP